jgi:hypothetical protein
MRQAFVVRRSFEAMFSGIGACSGNPLNVGAASDQVDDLIPPLSFRKRAEANVAHRLSPGINRSAPTKPQLCATFRQGIRTKIAVATRCGVARSVASLAAAGACYP